MDARKPPVCIREVVETIAMLRTARDTVHGIRNVMRPKGAGRECLAGVLDDLEMAEERMQRFLSSDVVTAVRLDVEGRFDMGGGIDPACDIDVMYPPEVG